MFLRWLLFLLVAAGLSGGTASLALAGTGLGMPLAWAGATASTAAVAAGGAHMAEAGYKIGSAAMAMAGLVRGGGRTVHHVATNKNFVSAARGGPWSPKFKELFDRAGMSLDDALNKISMPGHKGPHPEAYHKAVYDRLFDATQGLTGDAYRSALHSELRAIGTEAVTPGSILNKLLTKQPL